MIRNYCKTHAQSMMPNPYILQKQGEITLKGFQNGDFRVLVVTNVVAHRLDIPEVSLVIQDCHPKDVESYIHYSE